MNSLAHSHNAVLLHPSDGCVTSPDIWSVQFVF